MIRRIITCCFGLLIAFTVGFGAFGSVQSVHAQSYSPLSTITKTEKIILSKEICDKLKKAAPGHDSDPNACVVTMTHTLVGTPEFVQNLDGNTMALKPGVSPNSCGGGNTVTAYDDLTYSFFWKEELYTQFQYNARCTPNLNRINGYVKYAIIGLTSLTQSTEQYTSGSTKRTGVENIVSTNGVFGAGVQFSSCQSRSLDGNANWPYYSNLSAQDC